ncbi:MAG: YcxB family protein [Synechococcaceae cyanobacterium SM2_3_60]|nr:YcxB family protein [Synechococcaceae cyanobacterium SM2_3_60]
MELQTEIQLDDWSAFVNCLVKRAWSGRGARWLQIFIPAGLGVLVGLIPTLLNAELNILSFVLGLVLGIGYILVLSHTQARHIQPDARGYILGPRTVCLTADGIGERATTHSTVFYWPTVREVIVAPKHLFVLVDNNGALIIPRRAFADEAACDAFQAEIERYRKAAETAA